MNQLTPAWTPLRAHPQQSAAWRSNARFKGLFAGRGSGKSEVARRYIVRWLPVKKEWPDPIYLYALPTYNQARRVAWTKIEALIPGNWIAKKNQSNMTIQTKWGSTLYVMGLDKPERAEGVQWDGAILDESCDLKPDVFGRSLLPAFSHRRAWCWRIGVPKRFGIGSDESREFFERGLKGQTLEGTNDRIESFTWPSSDILSPEDLAFAAYHLDPKDYNEQYNASWESIGGSIFHAFSERNIRKVYYDRSLPIHLSCDFNVNPMCWVLGHVVDGRLRIFDEVFIRNCNTPEALEHVANKYPIHESGWVIYGDATMSRRDSAASSTNYMHIYNFEGLKNKKFRIDKSNPNVGNRFAACNALFCNALGDSRFDVDPDCKHLIRDLKSYAYKDGTSQPLKRGDASHMADSIGYLIYKRFPMKARRKQVIPEASVR